jgi:hypothetical protein
VSSKHWSGQDSSARKRRRSPPPFPQVGGGPAADGLDVAFHRLHLGAVLDDRRLQAIVERRLDLDHRLVQRQKVRLVLVRRHPRVLLSERRLGLIPGRRSGDEGGGRRRKVYVNATLP